MPTPVVAEYRLDDGVRVLRAVTKDDIEENLVVWLEMWAER